MSTKRQGRGEKKQLHIAMLISGLAQGGTERVLANLVGYLVEQGDKVTVVTQYLKEDEYPLKPQVKRIVSEIEDSEQSKNRLVNFKRRFLKLRNIWKQEKPDIILSFIGKNNLMAILTTRLLKIPVAVAVRGDPAMEYYNGWMRFMARNLFKKADGIILQTRQSYEFFPAQVRRKAVILKNPVSLSFFRERYRGERDKELVAVGRIDGNKNHEMLIRAFAGIAGKYPDHRLVIYGEGELKDKLERLVAELGMQERIILPGAVTDVAEAIYKAKVFILPSNTEGVPNTLIEAMVMGLAVIATNCPCGGPEELIEHGVNGLLTPVGDVEKMKENIEFVLDDLYNADLMGEHAKKTADIYRPEKIYKEWRDYLYSLGMVKK